MEIYPATAAARNYDRLVVLYDRLASLWSGGAIRSARLWCARQTPSKRTVLVIGPGTGEDAALCCARGAEVQLIDVSKKMLAETVLRCKSSGGAEPVAIHDDFRTVQFSPPPSDILLPFVLNIFCSDELPQILRQVRESIAADGRILISDFSPPAKFFATRLLMELWHGIPMAFFYLLTGNAWHGVHDLPGALEEAGLTIVQRKKFRIFGIGPRWIEALIVEIRSHR
ncbi:MAG: methyltransferase domain-containing protein [Planctomycetota bacterium]|nr:methyltransferase domain-containing protein [Planctomycetota bacterium]